MASHALIQKKVCLLGNVAVGKTSLVRQFVEGIFDDRYLSTIGVKVSRRQVLLPSQAPVNLLIWDLAGNGDLAGLQTDYLRGAAGALLVCDLTRPETLDSLVDHARNLWQVQPGAPLVIAANKADLVEQRRLADEAIGAAVAECQAEWVLSSAKNGFGVEDAFDRLTRRIFNDER